MAKKLVLLILTLTTLLVIDSVLPLQARQNLPPAQASISISIHNQAPLHQISPLIYGMNYASPELLQELRLPLNRWGGNSTSRYNWQTDMSNKGSDWFFENIPEDNPDISQLPHNSAADRFISRNNANGTASLLTVPLIGYVAKPDSPRNHPYACGFKVSKYGLQNNLDPWDTDCGDGLNGATRLLGNDPADTSIVSDEAFVKAWIEHLLARSTTVGQAPPLFYNLDNEPGLWHETHRDVHPQAAGYDELGQRGISYAAAIKEVYPQAQILGPVQDGWTRYFYSSYVDFASATAERAAHNNKPFVQWYLEQMAAAEETHGRRLLDYLDLHYYPQAPGVTLAPAGNQATQALRLSSTRALWDPSYVDESWIKDTESANTAVMLLPRMKEWINSSYPGTKIAISEYNWGGHEHINGALALADVLGIFGREDVGLATLWSPPTKDQPAAFAFRIYRNYNGAGGSFGNTSLQAVSSDQAIVSTYAALRSNDGALTIILINKSQEQQTVQLSLDQIDPESQATLYRYSASQLDQIEQIGVSDYSSLVLPSESISLVEIRRPVGEQNERLFLPSIYKEK
jgi:hypothetical protein